MFVYLNTTCNTSLCTSIKLVGTIRDSIRHPASYTLHCQLHHPMLYPGVGVEGDHSEVAVVRDLVSDQVLGGLPHPLPHIRQGGGGLHDQDVLRQWFTDNIKPWDQASLELVLSA